MVEYKDTNENMLIKKDWQNQVLPVPHQTVLRFLQYTYNGKAKKTCYIYNIS